MYDQVVWSWLFAYKSSICRKACVLEHPKDSPGLVAQGRTVAETLEIARDVARKLIEARRERDGVPDLPSTSARATTPS